MKKQVLLSLALGLSLVPLRVRASDAPRPLGSAISWTTPDGVRLAGLYLTAKPNHLTWILLHGLGSNKQEWLPFVRRLARQGDGFLIYDARGHGDSTRSAKGPISYQDFKTAGSGSPWEQMINDIDGAVTYLHENANIDAKAIAVGGASLGANVALVYASRHDDVPALLLLSPGVEYAGIKSEAAFKRYGTRPVFIAASPGDAYAYASVRQLIVQRKDVNCKIASGDGAAHGVNMLNAAFTQKLLDWIKTLK